MRKHEGSPSCWDLMWKIKAVYKDIKRFGAPFFKYKLEIAS
jgi:hypothetical protein